MKRAATFLAIIFALTLFAGIFVAIASKGQAVELSVNLISAGLVGSLLSAIGAVVSDFN